MSIKLSKIINAVLFYTIWWGTIISIIYNLFYMPIVITLIISFLHFTFFSKNKYEIIFIIYCMLIAIIYEGAYLNTGIIKYTGYLFDNNFFPPLWTICMWVSLGITINHSIIFTEVKNYCIHLNTLVF